jgi:DNA-binding SARP family transcriptional activator
MSDLAGVAGERRFGGAGDYDRPACCDDQQRVLDATSGPTGLRLDEVLERCPGLTGSGLSARRDGGAGVRGRVHVRLLDGFEVLVNGTPQPAGRWTKRYAAALVKLLAISPGGRLHRDRVVDALWPDAAMDAALPRLHKAAHYARRELGDRHAVVLRDQVVALFPLARLEVDAITFEVAADRALSTKPISAPACDDALKLAGDLLPHDLDEWWLDEPRDRLRLRVQQLLRGARRWQDLLRMDPANEEAHVELLREAVALGDRTNGLRRFVLMERALGAEFGISPGREATALLQRLVAS